MSDMTPEQVEKALRKRGDHNHRLAEWFRHERNDKKKAGDSDTHAQNFYDMADTVRRMREREATLESAIQAALRVEQLWLPPNEGVKGEHIGEAIVLHAMHTEFRAVLGLTEHPHAD